MAKVLFIEDNTEIRENMGEILELANYTVFLAPDGKKGVATAFAELPDIIVCDIMMPELDGYGVIHLLQKNPATKHIPFIFLTAMAERGELRKGMELGADDYITKPFSGTELLNAIEGRLKKAAGLKAVLPANSHSNEDAHTSNVRDLKQAFNDEQDSQTYQKKQRIYAEGSQPRRLYYVRSGKIKIYRTHEDGKDFIMSIHQAGEYFGYTALLEGTNYRETAEALEDAEIDSIARHVFEELMNDNKQVVQQVLRLLAGNVQEKEAQLLGIAYNSLRKKVADALMRLYAKYKVSDDAAPLSLHISRENLAALAGSAKESLIRTLGDFKEEGLIDISGGNIIILEEEKISKMLN